MPVQGCALIKPRSLSFIRSIPMVDENDSAEWRTALVRGAVQHDRALAHPGAARDRDVRVAVIP